jgi:tRNA-dihydrouridine synthase
MATLDTLEKTPAGIPLSRRCRTPNSSTVGNGDVRTVADVARIKAHTRCDGVMIGRAAIGNPWIFARKDRDQVMPQEKIALLRRHLALSLDFYGQERGLVLFRKHAAKYVQNLTGEAKPRVPLLQCNSVEEFDRMIEKLTDPSGLIKPEGSLLEISKAGMITRE